MILVTGAAGFIGAHVAASLARSGHQVIGLDNYDDGYDAALKRARVAALLKPAGVQVLELDCADPQAVQDVFDRHGITHVAHLAGRANVQDSMRRPDAFIQANINAFGTVIEQCRLAGVQHLVYASSSSVYGHGTGRPSHEGDPTDQPASLYAATKKANELMAHACSRLYGLPVTGLRLFTVYGPWGRPDMAPSLFSRAIMHNEPLRLFNHGDMRRDFIYIDDVAAAICGVLFKPPAPGDGAPSQVFNLGHAPPVTLGTLIQLLEQAYGAGALLQLEAMPASDVQTTWSDSTRLARWLGFLPATPLEEGVDRFAAWYRDFYRN